MGWFESRREMRRWVSAFDDDHVFNNVGSSGVEKGR